MEQNNALPEGFKMTELGVLPEEWEVVKLGDVFEFSRKPRGLNLSDFDEIPFIPMEYIPDEEIYLRKYDTKKSGDIRSGTFFSRGDLLVAKITPSFENGKQCIVNDLPTDFGYATTEVWPLHVTANSSTLYLFHYLKQHFVRSDVAGKMEGSTGRQRVPESVLANLTIPLPPLPEQKRIAAALSAVQEAKEKTEATINATRELKKSMMKHLFTYGPVPLEEAEKVELKETENGEVPVGWEVVKLEDVCSLRKETIEPENVKDMIYVGLEHIDSGELSINRWGLPSEVKSTKYIFYPGDILYGKLRPYLDKVALSHKDGICSTDILVFKAEHERILTRYLANFMHTKPFLDFSIMTMSGTNHPRTSWTKLKTFQVPLPPIPIQENIIELLSAFDSKIETEKNRKTALDELFKTLLNDLMTAKIRVNHLPDGVVENA